MASRPKKKWYMEPIEVCARFAIPPTVRPLKPSSTIILAAASKNGLHALSPAFPLRIAGHGHSCAAVRHFRCRAQAGLALPLLRR